MKNYFLLLLLVILFSCSNNSSNGQTDKTDSTAKTPQSENRGQGLDTALYDKLMKYVANGDTTGRWPVKHEYPLPGALLPFNRLVAYYGNLYSTKMGALGKWPKNEMI